MHEKKGINRKELKENFIAVFFKLIYEKYTNIFEAFKTVSFENQFKRVEEIIYLPWVVFCAIFWLLVFSNIHLSGCVLKLVKRVGIKHKMVVNEYGKSFVFSIFYSLFRKVFLLNPEKKLIKLNLLYPQLIPVLEELSVLDQTYHFTYLINQKKYTLDCTGHFFLLLYNREEFKKIFKNKYNRINLQNNSYLTDIDYYNLEFLSSFTQLIGRINVLDEFIFYKNLLVDRRDDILEVLDYNLQVNLWHLLKKEVDQDKTRIINFFYIENNFLSLDNFIVHENQKGKSPDPKTHNLIKQQLAEKEKTLLASMNINEVKPRIL